MGGHGFPLSTTSRELAGTLPKSPEEFRGAFGSYRRYDLTDHNIVDSLLVHLNALDPESKQFRAVFSELLLRSRFLRLIKPRELTSASCNNFPEHWTLFQMEAAQLSGSRIDAATEVFAKFAQFKLAAYPLPEQKSKLINSSGEERNGRAVTRQTSALPKNEKKRGFRRWDVADSGVFPLLLPENAPPAPLGLTEEGLFAAINWSWSRP